jgi:hypothetical protein
MTTARHFRTDSDAVYEAARHTLDDAWGLSPPITSISPATDAPRDVAGRIVLGVRLEYLEYPVAVDLLPQLIASGAVEEITLGEYMDAVMRIPGE